MASEGISQKFRARGWVIGNREGGDICPKCIEAAKKPKAKKESNVVHLQAPVVAVEPPREMKREDRRLIFSKIEDVYLDEKQGYSTGWSDKKVADDLGVPLAWVRSIREENFGVEFLNEDVKKIICDTKELLSHIDVELSLIEKASDDLQKRRDEFLKRYDHIAKRAAEIEKLFN